MLRALLIGLAIFVIAVVLISAVAHLLNYGFLFLVATIVVSIGCCAVLIPQRY